jgi:hypothetical protein
LAINLQYFDNNLPAPYLLVRPKENFTEIKNAFADALSEINPDLIIAVDMGGDSLTCGLENENGFDRTGLRALKALNQNFIYIVLGIGCDGESTIAMINNAVEIQYNANSLLGKMNLDKLVDIWYPISSKLLEANRTPNIIANAKFQLDSDNYDELTEIPRHEKHLLVPTKWLNKGLVFDGNKLNIYL